jgi:hypothetical protein
MKEGYGFSKPKTSCSAFLWWLICSQQNETSKLKWAEDILNGQSTRDIHSQGRLFCTMSKDIDGLIWIHYKERRMRLAWDSFNSDMDSKQQKHWRCVSQTLVAIVSSNIVLLYGVFGWCMRALRILIGYLASLLSAMMLVELFWWRRVGSCAFSLVVLLALSVQWRSWPCFDGEKCWRSQWHRPLLHCTVIWNVWMVPQNVISIFHSQRYQYGMLLQFIFWACYSCSLTSSRSRVRTSFQCSISIMVEGTE